jgi:hypothetical protein
MGWIGSNSITIQIIRNTGINDIILTEKSVDNHIPRQNRISDNPSFLPQGVLPKRTDNLHQLVKPEEEKKNNNIRYSQQQPTIALSPINRLCLCYQDQDARLFLFFF